MFHEENFLRGIYRVRGFITSLILVGLVYVALKYLFPQVSPLFSSLERFAFPLDLIPLFIPVIAFVLDVQRHQKLIIDASLQILREMPYLDFHLLVVEALRREGFSLEEKRTGDIDHQIDLILYKDDYRIVALLKHWESFEIDSFQVQELYERMIRDGADVSLFITTGNFTEEARRLARSKSIVLADGKALLELVRPVQADSKFESASYLRRASLELTY